MTDKKLEVKDSSSKTALGRSEELKRKWLNDEIEAKREIMASSSEAEHLGEIRALCADDRTPSRSPLIMRRQTTFSLLANRPPITIDFSDVCYTVDGDTGSDSNGKKKILKSISGCFKTGELTAIMGPSGAGKTMLMNIIAGYVTTGVTGSVRTNAYPRQINQFHKLSSYIMQDDLLQPRLSVEELMTIAANLKVGNELTTSQKKQLIEEVLNTLGLLQCRETRTEKLSGGQRKRLSVALELVSNPPVLFLDEPTTGLDIVSMGHLINFLKMLAKQGRTIICSLHQPTASVFKQFDHVYVLAKGSCVYQGSPDQLVPFLANAGCECPVTYNPADYIIEIIHDGDSSCINHLSNEIENGKFSCKAPKSTNEKMISRLNREKTVVDLFQQHKEKNENNFDFEYATNFFIQFWILLKRMLTQQIRNKTAMWTLFISHSLTGLLLGNVYIGVGNDATRFFDNFKFVVTVIVGFHCFNLMAPVVQFPIEIKLVRREKFNNWYGLKSYFAALTISSIPRHVVFGTILCVLSYFIADQPLDMRRFLIFELICLLTGFTAESVGLTVASVFNIQNGSLVAPTFSFPLLAFGIYGIGYGKAISSAVQFIISLSFLRNGIVAATRILLGHDRPLLYCDVEKEVYCHYADTTLLLKDLGMYESSTTNQIIYLAGFVFFYRIVAFSALKLRLTTDFSNPLLRYFSKVFRKTREIFTNKS